MQRYGAPGSETYGSEICASERRRPEMRKSGSMNRQFFVCGILACGALLSGCAQKAPGPADVGAMAAVSPTLDQPGTVDIRNQMVISSPDRGVIGAVMVQDGKSVASGEAVSRLNDPDAIIRRDMAQRKLALFIKERNDTLARSRGVRPTSAPVPASSSRATDIMAAKVNMQYAKAALDNARQEYNSKSDLRDAVTNADIAVRTAQQAVDSSYGQLKAAESDLPAQEARHEAVKRLYATHDASQEELRTAMQQVQQASAAVDTARAGYNRDLLALWAARQQAAEARQRLSSPTSLRSNLLAAEDRYAQSVVAYRRAMQGQGPVAQAQESGGPPDTSGIDQSIVEAQSDLLAAQEAVQRLNIQSPMAGTIYNWNTTVGETVQAGQALGWVADLTHLKVTTDVSPSVAAFLPPGTSVDIVVKMPSERVYHGGRVAAASPIIDQNTGKQRITIFIDDPTQTLEPGSSVVVKRKQG